MGEVVQIAGQLLAGPQAASDTAFPGAIANVPLQLYPNPRPYNVATGVMLRTIATSVGVYVSLDGVPNTVQQGTFLYLRALSPLLIRRTRIEPSSSNVVTIDGIQGIFMMEYDPLRPLILLEASGSGQLEYFVSGNQ